MDVEQQQELLQCIAGMADMAAVCSSHADKELIVMAIGYLVTLQSIVSRKMK